MSRNDNHGPPEPESAVDAYRAIVARGLTYGKRDAKSRWDWGDLAVEMTDGKLPMMWQLARLLKDIVGESDGTMTLDDLPSAKELDKWCRAALAFAPHQRDGISITTAYILVCRFPNRSERENITAELKAEGALTGPKVIEVSDHATRRPARGLNSPRQSLAQVKQRQAEMRANKRELRFHDVLTPLIEGSNSLVSATWPLPTWSEDMWLTEREQELLDKHLTHAEDAIQAIRQRMGECETLPDIEPGDKVKDTIPSEWTNTKEGEKE